MKRARMLIVSLAAACLLVLSACGPQELPQDSATSTDTSSVSGNTKENSGNMPVQQDTVDKTETTPTTPEQTKEDPSDMQKESVETPVSTAQEQLFTDCNETLYVTTTVNVRSSYSTNSDKLGSLTKAQSVKRTGIGTGAAAGWSRIEFNGKVAYVSSDYLSTTKPQVSTGSNGGSSSGQTSKPSSKPSTGGNSGSSGGQTSKPSTSTGGSTSSGGSNQVGQPPASGGMNGLLDYTDPSSNPDAFKDNQSEGNAGINVN